MNSMVANDIAGSKPEDIYWLMCTKAKRKGNVAPHIQSELGSQEAHQDKLEIS